MAEKRLGEKKKNLFAFFIILLALFIIKGWNVFLVKVPWISDEAGVWQTAEYLIGHGESWKSYILFSGRKNGFYGVLPSILYLPAIAVSRNPVFVYRLCLFLNMIMLALAAYMAYKIIREILGVKWNVSIIMALACVVLYPVLFNANVMMTETVFTLWAWIVYYVLIRLVQREDTGVAGTVLFSFLLALGYLIHSRCLIVYGMTLLIIVLHKIMHSGWIVRPFVFMIMLLGILFLFSSIAGNIQNYFWGADHIVNSTEYTATKVFLIGDVLIHNFKAMIRAFVSLTVAFSIETCGLLFGCLYISVAYVRYILYHLKIKEEKEEALLFLFAAGCFWGMNLCIAIMSHSPSRNKWFVYTRYATPFLGEYILVCLYFFYKLQYSWKKLVLYHLALMPMAIKWIVINWPVLLADAKMGMFDSAYFFGYKLMAVVNEHGFNSWVAMIVALVLLSTGAFLILVRGRKIKYCALGLMVFSSLLFVAASLSYMTPREFSARYWDKVDSTYACMQRYQLEEYDIRYMGSDSFYLPAQLMLSKYDALCVEQFDKIESESTVYVSDLLINGEISEYIFELGTEEYLYTSDRELCELLCDTYKRIK